MLVVVRMVVGFGSEIDGVAITKLSLLILVAGRRKLRTPGNITHTVTGLREGTRGLYQCTSLPGPDTALFIIPGIDPASSVARDRLVQHHHKEGNLR